MLTESQVQRSFRNLVDKGELSEELYDKAYALLDDLRPESPLRHRLATEIEELRKLALAKN